MGETVFWFELMFELILDFGVVFRMNFSLTCMTGMFLDFGDDVAGYFFESMSFNSFCMLLCKCMFSQVLAV